MTMERVIRKHLNERRMTMERVIRKYLNEKCPSGSRSPQRNAGHVKIYLPIGHLRTHRIACRELARARDGAALPIAEPGIAAFQNQRRIEQLQA